MARKREQRVERRDRSELLGPVGLTDSELSQVTAGVGGVGGTPPPPRPGL